MLISLADLLRLKCMHIFSFYDYLIQTLFSFIVNNHVYSETMADLIAKI